MRCPFVYSDGKQCKGQVIEAWRKWFYTGEMTYWIPDAGDLKRGISSIIWQWTPKFFSS